MEEIEHPALKSTAIQWDQKLDKKWPNVPQKLPKKQPQQSLLKIDVFKIAQKSPIFLATFARK